MIYNQETLMRDYLEQCELEHKAKMSVIEKSYKPYDIVSDEVGNVGFIQEVNLNISNGFSSYSIEWLVIREGRSPKSAWWDHRHLVKHCNMFTKIAEVSCHPMGSGSKDVVDLMGSGV